MTIAVTYNNGQVFQHFGKTQQFKLYTIEDNKIVESKVIGTDGNSHHGLAPYIKGLGVETLILGNLGDGAVKALEASGIKFYPGVTGDADKAVEDFLAGTLQYNLNARCDHKHEHHHD